MGLPAGAQEQRPGHESSTEAAAPEAAPTKGEAEPVGGPAGVEAAAARRFAVQQEQLALAQEEGCRLEAQLRQQRQVVQEQARELSTLRAQLAAAAGSTGRAQQGAPAPQGEQQGGGTRPCGRCGASADSELRGGAAGEGIPAWLRLKYLEGRTALERSTASNTRLLRELEGAREQVQALQQELSWQEQQLEEAREQAQRRDQHPPAQTPQWQGPVLRGHEPKEHPRWRGEAWTAHGSASFSNTPDQGMHSAEPAGLRAVSTTTVLQLKQQLAEANYRASRLQIELDAAHAKLAALQENSDICKPGQADSHSLQRQQQGQQAMPLPPPQQQAVISPLPLRTLQPRHAQPVGQLGVQHNGSWCRSARTSSQGTAACSVRARGLAGPMAGTLAELLGTKDTAGESGASRQQKGRSGQLGAACRQPDRSGNCRLSAKLFLQPLQVAPWWSCTCTPPRWMRAAPACSWTAQAAGAPARSS